MRTITAEIAIPEKEIADVTVGQDVALKVRAYPAAHLPRQSHRDRDHGERRRPAVRGARRAGARAGARTILW